MKLIVALASAALIGTAGAGSARAQAPDPLARAMAAYQDLDYDSAAGLFRLALLEPRLPDAERVRALMHLGATELFRERRDSAGAAFRRLVLFDPRFRPDQLRFPPEVSSLFQEVRLGARAVVAVAPTTTRISGPGDRMQIRLYASTLHEIVATIGPERGAALRTVYSGAIGDSLGLLWDGRLTTGALVDPGQYVLRVVSRSAEGRPVRQIILPIEVARERVDTLPLPPRPADSLLRPELLRGTGGARSLLTGLLAAGATIALPPLVSSGEGGMTARYAVAGALSAAGIAGLLKARRSRPLPDNMAWNRQLITAWERDVARLHEQNVAILRDQATIVRAGVSHPEAIP